MQSVPDNYFDLTEHCFVSIVRDLQPRSFTKIAFTERLFEVSWLPPINFARVVSYTVYWCKSEDNRDRPYQVRIWIYFTRRPIWIGFRLRNYPNLT